ncbi:MAG: hypothetical protein ABW005_01020 [Burkholderiaceae bacterium]
MIKPLRSARDALRSVGGLLERHERRLGIAGLLLAQLLLIGLYLVLADNQQRVGRNRDEARLQAQARHRCMMEMERSQRDSCLVGLAQR